MRKTAKVGFMLLVLGMLGMFLTFLIYAPEWVRKASETELPESGGVKLTLVRVSSGVSVIYGDGTAIKADGVGGKVLTFEEYKQTPHRFKSLGITIPETSFPVVIFYNSSGFDATGLPVAIRQAADGAMVWAAGPRILNRPCFVFEHDGGAKRMALFADGTTGYISPEDWVNRYLSVPITVPPRD